MFRGVESVTIAVPDIEAAIDQYRAFLGREPSTRGDTGTMKTAWFDFEATSLELVQDDDAPPRDQDNQGRRHSLRHPGLGQARDQANACRRHPGLFGVAARQLHSWGHLTASRRLVVHEADVGGLLST